ncbi:MAG: Holliday junction branch migration protein RuvA [Candidatus Paceibacterota bacterium]
MIRQINGEIVYCSEQKVVVNVAGIGYEVRISEPAEQFIIGTEVTFYTYLAVRENALDLYGFSNYDSLEIFELLITLPKIGPKSAQQILSQAETGLLKQAVLNGDPEYLSKMSGIGKKSAEKIVTGLKEKFDEHDDNEPLRSATTDSLVPYARDTIDALVSLGYSQQEARNAVRHIEREQPQITHSTEALKAALKMLSS